MSVQAPTPGLTTEQARARLARDGANLMPEPPRQGLWRQFVAQLTHLLALLLWVAALFALLAGMPELSVAIVVIVLLNAVFAFWQEYRADRSTQRLRRLLPTRTRVVRDGAPVEVDVSEVVVGDLVELAPGDRVPADLVVTTAEGLAVDESLVTGESRPVPHAVGHPLLAGTFVTQGEGTATVSAVGSRTTLADIATLAQSAERPPSPLSQQLSRVVRVVAVVAVSTGVLLGVGAVSLGLSTVSAFLFAVGVAVALVPEGLLPTVTLSLARGARLMAERRALVRRLDAVETLGATTFICTDKTGTITQNRMAVVDVVTPAGRVSVEGRGYEPTGLLHGSPEALAPVTDLAARAAACVSGRVVLREGEWVAEGDPMEAALHCLARRAGVTPGHGPQKRRPYSPDRMVSSSVTDGSVSVLGAPEQVFARCRSVPPELQEELARLTAGGRRVLAVAARPWSDGDPEDRLEQDLEPLGLLGVEDPPREGIEEALRSCRTAEVRVAMLTGDHPSTAEAIAREVGLLGPTGVVVIGGELPDDDRALGALLDQPDGAVVARVTPADKFRIARALRSCGHVVAMTGDGVNDAPALREADVGVAMGASGSDVAREAADLVLLDDHFGTIVTAIELGRATFRNVRRFLTYHLTDNVAELAPFVVWALTGSNVPLAIGVLQVLALDIGTDMLPALALGAEPPNRRIMLGRPERSVLDGALLRRAFGVLGLTEAAVSMGAFWWVLHSHGWSWGETPSAGVLALASGTTFATISLCQMANAFACRSTVAPVWRMGLRGNPLVGAAVLAELVLLLLFVGLPRLSDLLGGAWPSVGGWVAAGAGAVLLVLVDGTHKRVLRLRRRADDADL